MPTTVTASYTAYAVFTIPKQYRHLPETCFYVRYGTLNIETDSGVVEVQAHYDPSDCVDWKRPDTTKFDEDDPQSDEEEEAEAEAEADLPHPSDDLPQSSSLHSPLEQ